MENPLFQWAAWEPTAATAYWAKAQLAGPWWWPLAAHAARFTAIARPDCARHTATMQSVASARGAVRWWVIGDKVFTSTIPIAPATSHYTKT